VVTFVETRRDLPPVWYNSVQRLKLIFPTGVFLDNAQELVKRPALTEEDLLRRFHTTVNDAHARGLTSIHDAGFDPMSLNFFKR
jgi:predicted amidohydrolase YtcJ